MKQKNIRNPYSNFQLKDLEAELKQELASLNRLAPALEGLARTVDAHAHRVEQLREAIAIRRDVRDVRVEQVRRTKIEFAD